MNDIILHKKHSHFVSPNSIHVICKKCNLEGQIWELNKGSCPNCDNHKNKGGWRNAPRIVVVKRNDNHV